MKKLIYCICMGLAILGILGGCSVTDMKKGEQTALDYTVVPQEDLPEEILNLVEEKKENDFQMTYQDENYLYLIRGYGMQEQGGYSVQVEELSMGDTAITLKTNLLGPSKEDKQSQEPSYPYIVLKIEYRDMPVQFQ